MRGLMSEIRTTTTVRMRSDLYAEAVTNESGRMRLVLRRLELPLLDPQVARECSFEERQLGRAELATDDCANVTYGATDRNPCLRPGVPGYRSRRSSQ
jgi:hypothetical protein